MEETHKKKYNEKMLKRINIESFHIRQVLKFL